MRDYPLPLGNNNSTGFSINHIGFNFKEPSKKDVAFLTEMDEDTPDLDSDSDVPNLIAVGSEDDSDDSDSDSDSNSD